MIAINKLWNAYIQRACVYTCKNLWYNEILKLYIDNKMDNKRKNIDQAVCIKKNYNKYNYYPTMF